MNAPLSSLIEGRPLLDTKLATTPTEFARLLRAQGDVFWWEPDRFFVVTDHRLATAILKGTDFSADRSAFFGARLAGVPLSKVGSFLDVVGRMMVTSDPPRHTARRRLAAFGIADHVIDAFRPSVERIVDGLLSALGTRESFDLVRDVALPLPCTVLADLFSIPAERRPDFYRWANAMTQFFGGASDRIEQEAQDANVGAASLRDYFTDLIRSRRERPQDDFLSHLLAHQGETGLDDREVISQAVMMLVAGSITTTDQICNNMYALLAQGPRAEVLRDAPELLDAALEEANRLDPAVNFVFRVAAKDAVLGSRAIAAGSLVFISNHAVNRDPAVFEAPDDFRLDRAKNPHVSFGSGIHYCLGARLGRIQMSVLFSRLLARFDGLAVHPTIAPVRKQQSLGFSGFESLVLTGIPRAGLRSGRVADASVPAASASALTSEQPCAPAHGPCAASHVIPPAFLPVRVLVPACPSSLATADSAPRSRSPLFPSQAPETEVSR